ncbi:glycerophosphoryl diester phosphodiesterase membrane domain-containing protein [Sphingomonas japonica]|uniref:Glycerophosphoryl diester phosphodiesterase membrane domain-containing protein n=1 Tax=Sphingomonas japonica TaxID=511662 RepID=A0ABX0TXC2_9SPHN|nr:glycerophosphoryl diester phosphodiesterase membrane domain-containing protein [Sphingomonas japonica]NIJ22951.1 hypothetical protein [Sphingomonas japonica]
MVKTGGARVSIGTVWDRTTAFVADHLAAIVPIALLTIFVPSSLGGALESVATPTHLAWVVSLAGLALMIVSLLGQLALTALVLDPAAGMGAIGRGLARLLPAFGVFLVVLLGMLALALPIVGIAFVYGAVLPSDPAAMSMSGMPEGAAGPILLYAIALIAVVMWVTARLFVATPAIVAERRGLSALKRSFQLTRGTTWKLIGVILLYGIVVLVATLAAQSLFGAIFALTAGSGDGGELSLAKVLTAVVVSLVTTAFTVLQAVFVAQFYIAAVGAVPAAHAVPEDSSDLP